MICLNGSGEKVGPLSTLSLSLLVFLFVAPALFFILFFHFIFQKEKQHLDFSFPNSFLMGCGYIEPQAHYLDPFRINLKVPPPTIDTVADSATFSSQDTPGVN